MRLKGRKVNEPKEPDRLIPLGWDALRWSKRLEEMAVSCESIVPNRAKELRDWAKEIEDKHV